MSNQRKETDFEKEEALHWPGNVDELPNKIKRDKP